MPGGGTTADKVENKDPWAPAQGYLQDIMAKSQQTYNSGAGQGVYGGQRVAGLDPATLTGIGRINAVADSNFGPAREPFSAGLGAIQNNGLTQAYNAPLTTMGDVYTGAKGIGTGGDFANLTNQALTQNAGANGILGSLASNPAITNGGAYNQIANQAGRTGNMAQGAFGGLAGQALGQNRDVGGMLGGAMSSPSLTTGSQFGQVAQNAAGPTSSATNLGGMASGADAGKNPYLLDMLNANDARIANRVNSTVAGMGRYGSGGHTDVLARSLAEADNPVLAQAYESDRNRMLSASGQIDSSQRAADATRLGALQGQTGVQQGNFTNMLGAGGQLAGMRQNDVQLGGGLLGQGVNAGFQGLNTGLNAQQGLSSTQGQNAATNLNAANSLGASNRADTGLGIQGLQGQTGVQGQNIANQLGAAQNTIGTLNAGQNNAAQWASMMPALNNLQYSPGQQNIAAGSMLQGQNQSEINALMQQYQQQQQAPWSALNSYLGGVSGLGNIIGQSGTTTGNTQIQQQTPWTQYAGLGIAGLGLLSDRNEKTDIKKLGNDPDTGLPMYSYRYKDDPKSYPKVVGPMAQDIEEAMPGSTERIGGKLYVKPEATIQFGILATLNRKKAA
jgi:hypothetical protein